MPLIIDDIPFKTILPAIEKLTPKRGCNVLQIKQHSLRISLKHQIFVRDKACLHCGLEITKWAIFQGRKRNRSKIIPVNDDYVPFTIDHIIPKSKGGISDNSNYQTLCYDCNIKKDDKLEFTCPLNYQTLCYDCNIKKDDKLEFTSPLPEVQ
ncbi:MAG: hypothetical protein DWQ19_09085 [Crenarchaeota archaeon]|nr:MAG: hypothetical protein DWQ19_09085 [Thermoproteota archaeon]